MSAGAANADGPLVVTATRGSLVESVHRVHAVVSDARGEACRRWGDPRREVVLRSAAKPFQALPLVADGAVERFGIAAREVAVCCGSHSSEEEHLAAVRSILAKAGVDESRLACGPHAPFLEERALALAVAGTPPAAILNNCSGKHAGMLALSACRGWPLDGYETAEHPLQQRLRAEMAQWLGAAPADIPTAVDGCGVPTFAASLASLASAMARLARSRAEAPRLVLEAMARHPFMVAGTGRLCTRVMSVTGGRVLAKTGAKGVYAAADRKRGLGLALKVEDGSRQAAEVALTTVLKRAGMLTPAEADALAGFAAQDVRNTLGDRVGSVSAAGEAA